jgi:hypothetical protein
MSASPQLTQEGCLGCYASIEARMQEIEQQSAWSSLEQTHKAAILVGLALVVLLAVFGFRPFRGPDENVARARADVKSLQTVLLAYRARFGEFPATLADLVEQPPVGAPFIEDSLLTDPWGQPYGYLPTMLHPRSRVPLVVSAGPPGSNMLISNWSR